MKKRIISFLLVLCMLVALVPTVTPQAQALDLLSIFDSAGSIVRGSMNAAEQAKQNNWNFGQAFVGTFKSIGKELLGMDDDAPGTTVVVNQVDLSEVELELKNIQKTLKGQSLTLSQIKNDMNSNMQTISTQLSSLSSQIEDKTKQQQYYTYLTNYFSFYNDFYEAVSYYDQALSTLYSSSPTQSNIKNTFDQFYELKNVSYTGGFYSAIDRLGKYLRGEYMTTDPGSVVDILCEYYMLAGYNETQTAAAVKEFVAQTFYTYCLANYYYYSVALFQDTYIGDNHLDNYTTDFGTVLNTTQIEQLAKNALNNFASTTSHVFCDLNRHFCSVENLPVSYAGPAGTVSRAMKDSKMDVEPNSSITLPDSSQLIDEYLGDGFSDMFGGMCSYTYSCSDSAVKVNGDVLSFTGLTDGKTVNVQINCTVAGVSRPLHTYQFTGKTGKMAGGYGTMEYPYVMTTTDHFKAFSTGSYPEDSFVSLNADLDFNAESIDPVMWDFKGTFYGNGHTISNFKINYGTQIGSTKNFGLFGVVSGTIADLTVKDAQVQPFDDRATYCVGVIAGALTGGKLFRCEAVDSSAAYAADSSGTGYVGGLAGLVDKGTITGCISRNVDVTLGYNKTSGCVGGLVGFMKNNSTMTYSGREEGFIWQYQNTNTSNTAGGLVGTVWNSKMDHCWSYKTNNSYTDQFYSSCNFGSLVGRCSSLNSNWLYIYNGENAKESNLGYPELGYLEAGWSLSANLASDFTCSKIGMNVGYLTNGSGSGNPICLVKPMSIELNTEDVKTSYFYGEPLTLNGLGVTLKRGSEYITAKLVPYTVKTDYNAKKAGTYTVTISTTCGEASYKVTVAEKPHVYKQVLVPSTCTTEGSVSYVCQDAGCNATFGDVQTLPARGHTMTHHAAVSATCTKDGSSEYWACTVCEKYFSDAAGKTEIAKDSWVIKAGHKLTKTEAKAATCTTAGNKEYWTCSVCKKLFSDAAGTTETTAAAVKINAIGHKLTKTEAKAATCTEDGNYEYWTCETCHKVFKDAAGTEETTVAAMTIEKLGHSFTNYVYNNDAKVGVDGTETATCDRDGCNATDTRIAEGTALPAPTVTFIDVPSGAYYAPAVNWAVANNITAGTTPTTFSPEATCIRAQVVAFLWRAAGSPEPETTNNPFTDVKTSDYFYKAVLWASENGIVYGTSSTTFRPNQGCTRGQVAAFLWRAKGRPEPTTGNNPFTDVKASEYYAKAVIWAAENKIVYGTTNTKFSPEQSCTRAQIVTFLYRTYGK